MNGSGRAASGALLALALLAPACSRPPKGMRRLDSGDSNHWFRIDQRRRHLFYVGGGDLIATRLGVVNLESGRRKSYRLSPEHIVAIQPSFHDDTVAVAVESEGEADEGRYEMLKVDADSGRVLLRKPSDTLSDKDIVAFGEPAPLDRNAGAPAEGSAAVEAQAVGGPRPGLKTSALRGKRRSITLFPTETEPENVVLAPDGKAFASYAAADGKWKVEEFDPSNGVRRTVAAFSGPVESMAYVGQGLVLLRQGDGGSGPRQLAMVDATAGRVALELPWSDGESAILGADTAKRLLYIRMNEGASQTCWAVHFDEPALRAASAYLAAARGPNVRKLMNTDVMGLVVVGGMLIVLTALVAAARSR